MKSAVARVEQLGPYRILGELGRGGMGVVYRARRDDLQKEFALKVILPGQGSDAEGIARFRREAQAAAKLGSHPGIVAVHDIGEAGGRTYFAMDLVEGTSLDDELQSGELSPKDAARIIGEAARAVAHAHGQGILHRDLKPGNIMLAADGRTLVTDFGLAKSTSTDAESARLTKSGAILGTPAYMPPEQADGAGGVDARADVYALGATLYESLALRPPFEADSLYGLLAKIQREPPPPLRAVAGAVPADLEVITLKCLEKRAEDRYATAAALAEDLEAFGAGRPISARPPSAARRLSGALRKRRGLVLAGAAAVGAAAVATALILPQLSKEQASAAEAHREKSAAEQAAAAAAAQAFEQLRETARTALDAALELRRAGAPERMASFRDKVEAACDAVLEREPRAAEPHYWRGRLARAAMDYPAARAAQDAAVAADPAFAPARYERILLVSQAQAQRGAQIRREAHAAGDGSFLQRLAADTVSQRHRALVQADAEALERHAADSGLTPPQLLTARACAGFVAAADPGADAVAAPFFEVVATEGAPVEAFEFAGIMGDTRDDFALQTGLIERALQQDAGYSALYQVRGRIHRAVAQRLADAGDWPQERWRLAIADFQTAIRLTPQLASAHMDLGEAAFLYYSWQTIHREEDRATFALADRHLAEAARLDPANWFALLQRANVQHVRAQWLGRTQQAGEHAAEIASLQDSSRAICDTIIERHPEQGDAYRVRAVGNLDRAAQLPHDRDDERTRLLDLVERDLGESVRRMPGHPAGPWNLAILAVRRAAVAGRAGRDGLPLLRRAVEYYDEAERKGERHMDLYVRRSAARQDLGRMEALRGADPDATYAAAEADIDAAIALQPDASGLQYLRAAVRLDRATTRMQRGGDPTALMQAARADLDYRLQKAPDDLAARGKRGQLRILLSDYLARRNQGTEKELTAGLDDLSAYLEQSPGDHQARVFRANGCLILGDQLVHRGIGAHRAYRTAIADFDLLEAAGAIPADAARAATAKARRYLLENPEKK
ncbi:MAG: serine/threonine-protein kinase [Planctomycetota bacterium]|jgi:hypothetical protein